MSCFECDASKTIVNIVTDTGNYTLVNLASDGTAVSFSATEDNIDRKYDSLGNLLKAGSNIKRVTVNMRISCEGARQLWQDFKNPNNSFCGSTSIVDDCCTDENFGTSDIVSVNRPDIGDTVEYFDIELIGVYQ